MALLAQHLLLLHFPVALGWRSGLQFHLQTFSQFVLCMALEVAEQTEVCVCCRPREQLTEVAFSQHKLITCSSVH